MAKTLTKTTKHTVKDDEKFVKICKSYGISDWKSVWNDSSNDKLKRQRKKPDAIQAGDVVILNPPAPDPKLDAEQQKKFAEFLKKFRLKLNRTVQLVEVREKEGEIEEPESEKQRKEINKEMEDIQDFGEGVKEYQQFTTALSKPVDHLISTWNQQQKSGLVDGVFLSEIVMFVLVLDKVEKGFKKLSLDKFLKKFK
jgi:hypothetical protein